MRDQEKQAWSFVEGMTTQIMTLAAGTIVLTATLFERVFPITEATCAEKTILVASWGTLGVSVLLGILVYMRAIGLLGKDNEGEEEDDEEEEKRNDQKKNESMVYETLLRVYGCLQLVTFLLGIALFVVYVCLNLFF